MNTFEAVSVRPGELRLGDLAPEIQAGDMVTVQCLTGDGVPVRIMLNVTEKWAARAWIPALQCPCCSAPAWVLAIQLDAVACGRCIRRTPLQARRKNRARWRIDGLADHLALKLRTQSGDSRQLRRCAAKLARRAEADAKSVLELADASLVLANRAIRGQRDGA
jgi:hypothetical protein